MSRAEVDAPGYEARDSAPFFYAGAGAATDGRCYVFHFELGGGEHLGAAHALVGRPAEIEVCAAVRDGDDAGLQRDGAELVERTAVPAQRAWGLQGYLDVGFFGF